MSTRDVIFNMLKVIINNTAVCYVWGLWGEYVLEVLITRKKLFFYFFNFVPMWNGDWTCDNHFMMYVVQIIMLYTLNLYSTGC